MPRNIGRPAGKGLLDAVDRVHLLDRLVAQLLRSEHRAHLDPGRSTIGRERRDQLEGVRVIAASPCSSAIRSGGAIWSTRSTPGSPSTPGPCITKVHSPPTRNSNARVVVVNPSGPHHRDRCRT